MKVKNAVTLEAVHTHTHTHTGNFIQKTKHKKCFICDICERWVIKTTSRFCVHKPSILNLA